MDNRFVLKTVICLLMIGTASEAIFFDYPKKTLIDFLHSLKAKKEAAKKTHDDVHHYHLHYYPVPVSLVFDEHVKPVIGKHELEHLHREELSRSLGWAEQEHKFGPGPELVVPAAAPHHHEIVDDPWPHGYQNHDSDGLTLQDQIDLAAIRHKIEHHSTNYYKHAIVEPHQQAHVSLHLPFHQEIILHPPAPHKEEKKVHLFTEFLRKLQNIKNSLFTGNEEEKKSSSHVHCDDKIEKSPPIVTSKIRSTNAYAIYFHPKNLRKF